MDRVLFPAACMVALAAVILGLSTEPLPAQPQPLAAPPMAPKAFDDGLRITGAQVLARAENRPPAFAQRAQPAAAPAPACTGPQCQVRQVAPAPYAGPLIVSPAFVQERPAAVAQTQTHSACGLNFAAPAYAPSCGIRGRRCR